MDQPCGKPGKGAGAQGDHKGEKWVHPTDEKRGRDGSSQREADVHGKVGEIQQAVAYIHTQRKQGVHKPLLDYAY